MAPSTQLAHGAPYTPTSDAQTRHEHGVSKTRKTNSTGGGRAWSEDEEVYLLQTRLQKMPYKHIAKHLKKTELACRLHYHQLSHGTRRKTTSASPSPSQLQSQSLPSPTPSSPNLAPNLPSPILSPPQVLNTPPRSTTPESPITLQLTLPKVQPKQPPHPETPQRTSLPKPFLPNPLNLLPKRPLLPPPTPKVNTQRLKAIYANHRTAFWDAITADYGGGVSPVVLERAWVDLSVSLSVSVSRDGDGNLDRGEDREGVSGGKVDMSGGKGTSGAWDRVGTARTSPLSRPSDRTSIRALLGPEV